MNQAQDNGLRGERPYQYRENQTRVMSQLVFKKEYSLQTDDWFESGTNFAYSLHRTELSAQKYKSHSWWAPGLRITPVFVSGKTLEAIIKSRKGIFISQER